MAKYSDSDIKRLANAMKRNKDDGVPFSLLTGAGCSISAGIPLAPTLVKKIQEKFHSEISHKLDVSQHVDYGATMSCLSRAERKILLEPHLTAAKVNWAHIAIATMLDAGYVQRVLTFNFDSVLARACGLLGLYPAIYDFAASHSAETSYIASPAIVHLHGQGYGMVMLNSNDETRAHAENLRPLLRRVLNDAPVLVIGYSGTADAVFPVIKDVFSGEQRLYWASYGEDVDQDIGKLVEKGGNSSEIFYGTDADRFLCDLAGELGCFPPKLFSDPYGHLLDELTPVCDYPLDSDQHDILGRLRERLGTDQNDLLTERSGRPDLEKLMMLGEWSQIVERGDPAKPEEKDLVALAMVQEATVLLKKAVQQEQIDAEALLQAASEKYARAIEIKSDMPEAFNNWGTVHSTLAGFKEGAEADKLWQAAAEKYARAVQLKPDLKEAYVNWGAALTKQASVKEGKTADELWQAAEEKYARAIAINPDMHEAFSNWGATLSDQAARKDDDVADRLLQAASEKYARAIEIKPDKHEAFKNWGNALSKRAMRKEGIEAKAHWRAACEKYAHATQIKPDNHGAFNNWGNALSGMAALTEGAEGDKLRQEAIEKYVRAIDIKPNEHDAFNNWGVLLSKQAEYSSAAEAEAPYKAAADKFNRAIEIKPNKHEAFANWGNLLSDQAGRKEATEADILWKAAGDKYARAIELKPENFEVLANWGLALSDQAIAKTGDEGDALFQSAFDKFGQALAIKPNSHKVLLGTGNLLRQLTARREGDEADALLRAAIDHYSRATEIETSNYETFNNWGECLIERSKRQQNVAIRNQLLAEAEVNCNRSNELSPGSGAYNLACIESLRINLVESLAWLERCRATGHLDAKHMMVDRDLEKLRVTPEFRHWQMEHFPELADAPSN